MMQSNYSVDGMTCDNCVKHITSEVMKLPGVTSVDVRLDGGRMIVTSDESVPFEQIEAAVAEAGDDYTVTAS